MAVMEELLPPEAFGEPAAPPPNFGEPAINMLPPKIPPWSLGGCFDPLTSAGDGPAAFCADAKKACRSRASESLETISFNPGNEWMSVNPKKTSV
jgi:hypothetical protein